MSKGKDHKWTEVWCQQDRGLGDSIAHSFHKISKTITNNHKPNEDSSEEALDYQEEAAEILWSSKVEDDHDDHENEGNISLVSPKALVQRSPMPRRTLLDSPSTAKRSAITRLEDLQPLLPRTPQSSLALTLADRTAQSSNCCIFYPGMKLSQRGDLSPGSLASAVLHNLESECCSALPELLMLCTLPSGSKSQLWPIITGAEPLLLYALSMGPKWGLFPTITRAVLLLCNLPPGSQPTVLMSHPWDHAAVDLGLPLDPKSQLHAATAGLPGCSSTAGAGSGLTVSPGPAAARGLWSPLSTALSHPRARMPLCFSAH